MGQTRSKTAQAFALTLIAAAITTAAMAQTPPAPAGGAVVVSEPGKAGAVRAVEVSAKVAGIDKATHALALQGPKGEVFDIVASEDVKNFDQIKVVENGDQVEATYTEALALSVEPTPKPAAK